jgi:menaquinone-dependent protoporphyrinogen oxidase
MGGRRVLVAFAAKGEMARIAQLLGGALRGQGFDVDVAHVGQLRRRIRRYDAVLVGSPLAGRSWEDDAISFLSRHRRVLGSRPVWLFQAGAQFNGSSARLPADVSMLARRLGVIGVLNVMSEIELAGSRDETIASAVTNLEAIDQLASFVAHTVDHRDAI